jgi:hypothetical protein
MFMHTEQKWAGEDYPKPLREDGRRDLLVLGRLGDELVVCGLIEQHRVVHLLLLLSLAPLLQQPKQTNPP